MKASKINEELTKYLPKKSLSEGKQDGGYFIYNMIYFEGEECAAEVIEFLERKGYLSETDYSIVELTKDRYTDMLNEFEGLPIEDKTKSDGTSALTLEEIKEGLGDIARLFDENKIDLAIKVY